MPSPSEILAGLASIANEMIVLAIIWHVAIGLWIVALVSGWRPSRRLAAPALVLPLAVVGVLAWLYENPFNSLIFILASIGLAIIGSRLPSDVQYLLALCQSTPTTGNLGSTFTTTLCAASPTAFRVFPGFLPLGLRLYRSAYLGLVQRPARTHRLYSSKVTSVSISQCVSLE